MLIQIILILILVTAFVMTWKRVRENAITRGEAVAWSLLWVIAGIGIAQPQITTLIANFFGVGRGVDFVLYGSVVLLFVLVFRQFIAMDRIERKLTDVVRQNALKDLPKQDGKS
jgi:small membrane protein